MKKGLRPVGSKEFLYSEGNPVTEKQEFLIKVIEFAYRNKGVKFRGCTSKQAYDFIGKYYKYIEYNDSTGSVFLNGQFIGYFQEPKFEPFDPLF